METLTNQLNHLKKKAEWYAIQDPFTQGEFEVVVTEGHKGVEYKIGSTGTLTSKSIELCMALLKTLVATDCYSEFVREGEKPAVKIASKQKIKPHRTGA